MSDGDHRRERRVEFDEADVSEGEASRAEDVANAHDGAR